MEESDPTRLLQWEEAKERHQPKTNGRDDLDHTENTPLCPTFCHGEMRSFPPAHLPLALRSLVTSR